MAHYKAFAAADGSLRQFAASATSSATRQAGRAWPTRLLIDNRGDAADSWDPAWLMAEDCIQGSSGYSGVVYWDPDLADIAGGQSVTLVIQAYDLARRAGLRVTVPMRARRRNPLLRKPAGAESVTEIAVPRWPSPGTRAGSWLRSPGGRRPSWCAGRGARRRSRGMAPGRRGTPSSNTPSDPSTAASPTSIARERREIRGAGRVLTGLASR
jgi:hypothetical protein